MNSGIYSPEFNHSEDAGSLANLGQDANKPFEIVAHRGIPDEAPENTLASFQRAIELGADAFEMDVRLTADQIPVVYHYFYMDVVTSATGTIFNYTLEQLRAVEVFCKNDPTVKAGRISTLAEVLEVVGGKIGLEIEVKGPEPESAEIIAGVLNQYRQLWSSIEVTSYEPALLLAVQRYCPGIVTDLLFPPSESWMKQDVVEYTAIQRARLAQARAVHLHPTQLTNTVVEAAHRHGIEIHAWDVNDKPALELVAQLGIPRMCTDRFPQAHAFRERLMRGAAQAGT